MKIKYKPIKIKYKKETTPIKERKPIFNKLRATQREKAFASKVDANINKIGGSMFK